MSKIDDQFFNELQELLKSANNGFTSAMLDEEFLKKMDILFGEINIHKPTQSEHGNKTDTSRLSK